MEKRGALPNTLGDLGVFPGRRRERQLWLVMGGTTAPAKRDAEVVDDWRREGG
ncbi:hypothetical protein Droror1_Dr00016063, partial [Drosera rotundifolia]